MNNDIKDLLQTNSKNTMPNLWDKIESKLQYKKPRKSPWFLTAAAAIIMIFTISILNKNNIILDQEKVENNEVVVLEDLNLKEILKDKIRVNDYFASTENSYVDIKEIDINKESSAIIYGKVLDVKSFNEGDLICSNIEIEVIKDYKNNILEGEKILLESTGGELTIEEYLKNASEVTIWRNEYYTVEDKSKKIIQFDDGIPQYREGEYVLVYVFNLNKKSYYSEKEDQIIQPPTADYGAYSKLYVNPNTTEVYKYIYDANSSKLIKEHFGTLDSFENNN